MGIFDQEADLWRYYRVSLTFRERLMGGIPRDPKLIEGWLRSKAGVSDDEEIRQATLRTLMELGAEVRPDMTYAEMVEASEALAAQKSTNGFKRDEEGLYIEGRQVKAALKESINIHFAGERWGKTKKGPKSYAAERLFVLEDRIHLGRSEPDGIDLVIGHVSGPQGPRSTLTYHEYVERAEITFHVMESKIVGAGDEPSLDRRQWAVTWVSAQEQGIGALRSQGHGRFDVTAFDPVDAADLPRIGDDAAVSIQRLDDEAAG